MSDATLPACSRATGRRWLLPASALVTLLPFVPAGLALLLGATVALTIGNEWPRETRRLSHSLLLACIVGLGAGANLGVAARVGSRGVLQTAGSIVACLLAASLLLRVWRVPRRAGLLIGIGTAICGGSAIAAVAPVMRAKDEEISVALAVIFLLNGLALFIFPPVGHAVGLSAAQFGLWAALAIHDTSSVVGAALGFGGNAVEIATTLKLTRALWIVPVALGLSYFFRSEEAKKTSLPKPWFLVGFLIASALTTWVPAFHPVGLVLERLARRGMVLALYLIGAGLTRPALRAAGVRPLAYGATLWLLVGTSTLAIIRLAGG